MNETGKDMNETGHPSDWLPEYVRGEAPNPVEIEQLLSESREAREDVEILTALAESRVEPLTAAEREFAFRGLDRARRTSGSWLAVAWKIAAAIAILATGFGVWRIVTIAEELEWNPTVAVEAWEADLEDLRPMAADVMVALGYEVEPATPWEEFGSLNPDELVGPWEEDR